jgi:predicted dehydrogenase
MALFRGVGEGNVMKFNLNKVEPLEAEIRAFIRAATGDTPPAVTGLDALHALALVQLLLASAEQGQALRVRDQVAARGWAPMLGV